jgi:hypothetical protein
LCFAGRARSPTVLGLPTFGHTGKSFYLYPDSTSGCLPRV